MIPPRISRNSAPILLSISLCISICLATAQIVVNTRNGRVQGITETDKNGNVRYKFLGIPFAKPPIGMLRLEKPEPVPNWNGVLNATKFGNTCMQHKFALPPDYEIDGEFSEDCLNLNIYVPGNISKKRAVMVWVHGGAYYIGAGRSYNGQHLASNGNVIMVTINYRLGVFGFASTGDSNLPGNLGLWDQLLALQWIKGNIGNFGGDTSRITIFGESAGSGSVSLLSISPKSAGLFQRVIAESGSSLSPWATVSNEEAKSAAANTANALGCSDGDTASIVSCLKIASSAKLLNASIPFLQNATGGLAFAPTVDGDLLVDEPMAILRDKKSGHKTFAKLDYLTGMNSAESLILVEPLFQSLQINISAGINRSIAVNVIADAAKRLTPPGVHFGPVADALTEVYCSKTESDPALQGNNLVNFFNDYDYYAPTVKLLNSRDMTFGSTYMYYFTYYRPDHTLHLLPGSYPSWMVGANHADELPFVFGLQDWFPNRTFTTGEMDLSKTLMTLWTNFAKTGNPGKKWKQYDSNTKRYLDIGLAQTVRSNFFPKRMELWLKTLPSLVSSGSTTKSPSKSTEKPDGIIG